MSKQWSCETLKVGFVDVMADALKDSEQGLSKEIQDHRKIHMISNCHIVSL